MRAVRVLAITALLAAVGGAAAYVYDATRDYYPVVRIAAPQGLTFTALLDARSGLKACEAANAELIEPVARECKECRLVFAQCEDKDGALELTRDVRDAARQYWVVSEGLRIAVAGADARAKASCEAVAAQLVDQGMRSRCIHPRTTSRLSSA